MKRKTVTKILFILYCAVMLWLLFGQRLAWGSDLPYTEQLRENINLVPFATVRLFKNLLGDSDWMLHAISNLLGNIILFIPLGMLTDIFEKQRYFPRYILTVTVMIILVELIQLFTLLGSCDIDDLILNLIGATIGFLFSIPYRKKFEKA